VDAEKANSLLRFAEEVSPGLKEPRAQDVLEQLNARHAEIQQAMQWFLDQGHADEGFRLGNALVTFWMVSKRMAEGSVWFDRLLALPGGDDARRGQAFFDAGYLVFWQGNDELSSRLQHQALELGRRARQPTVTALSLVGLARIALRTDVEAARKLCREALAETEGTADRQGRSSAMHVLAVAAQMAGDLHEARDMMKQRIALARETGNLATVGLESSNLCMVERQLGNLEEADALGREALEISHRRGDGSAIPWTLNQIAANAASRKHFPRAATLLGAADAAMEAIGGAWPPDEKLHYESTQQALAAAMSPAELDRARAAGRAMTTQEAVDYALKGPASNSS
jgi:tetratricopeptide (TPR) repeat protein